MACVCVGGQHTSLYYEVTRFKKASMVRVMSGTHTPKGSAGQRGWDGVGHASGEVKEQAIL